MSSYFNTVIEVSAFMNNPNSPYIMEWVYNTRLDWKFVIRKIKKFFVNFLDSDTTIIVKDIFIFTTEDTHTKKITPGREKRVTLQKPVQILRKNFQKLIPDNF